MDFRTLISEIGGTGASNPTIRKANEARIPSDYLLASLLPEENQPTYNVTEASIVVKSLMASVVGMDSPYPEGTVVETSSFTENTIKLGHSARLTEQQLRQIQARLRDFQLADPTQTQSKEFLVDEMFNFMRKVIIQPQYDAAEWMRGQALTTAAITFTQNNIATAISYTGVPAANKFATRTTGSTQAYGAAGSVFWADMKLVNTILRGGIGVMIAHENTIWEIINNDANDIVLDGQDGGIFQFVRHRGSIERLTTDKREMIKMIAYNREAELRNPVTNAVTQLPFVPEGYIIVVGAGNVDDGYRVGQGTTDDPYANIRLGYTHVGPTVEANGALGRWSDLRTPDGEPWALEGRSVSNIMPVIQNGRRLVILSTEMA